MSAVDAAKSLRDRTTEERLGEDLDSGVKKNAESTIQLEGDGGDKTRQSWK